MPLEYSKAKNLSTTCKWNNFYLHSSYNPEIEAQRFCQTIKPTFIPENIIIIEPVLGYCKIPLQEIFPKAKLYAIRFINEINSQFSFCKDFFFEPNQPQLLETQLFNNFGETGLLNSLFVSWPPSQTAFKENDTLVWQLLKKLLKNCQNILATRQFFAERWIKNQINLLLNIKYAKKLFTTKKDILVCASGISLKKSISKIKKNRNAFYIIACSSAIKSLLQNQIIPDLCITTDGGYWAKKHLYCLKNCRQKINLAIASEAAIPLSLFEQENISITPLAYSDNFDNIIFEHFKIPFNFAKRNGTISGTALELALSMTNEKVFLCGIDLEVTNGFVHIQPNELELENSIYDYKLKPKDNRIYIQSRNSTQLEIYRNWFINNSENFKNRVYRIQEQYNFKHQLGKIQNLNFEQVMNIIPNSKLQKSNLKNSENQNTQIKLNISKKEILDYFRKLKTKDEWIENYFPADFLMIKRATNQKQLQHYKNQLDSKLKKIIDFVDRKGFQDEQNL